MLRLARQAMPPLGLRSERALAFSYDLIYNVGLQPLRRERVQPEFNAFERIYGRQPDEQERLLILANLATPSLPLPVRVLKVLRQRRLAFALGQGGVSGLEIDLDAAGLEMRDLASGVPIHLASDAVITQRLIGGWLPSKSTTVSSIPSKAPRACRLLFGPAQQRWKLNTALGECGRKWLADRSEGWERPLLAPSPTSAHGAVLLGRRPRSRAQASIG
jgi:hypothetical protein